MTDHDPKSIAANEVEFRTSVLVKLAEIGRDVTHVRGAVDETKSALATHIEHDNERFGNVDLKIGENTSGISKGHGIIAALVVMVGVIMALIQYLKP